MSEETTAYESDVFYSVIIKTDTFLGWSAPDVGLGRMRFVHPEKGEFKTTYDDGGEWMKNGWNEFLEFIAK